MFIIAEKFPNLQIAVLVNVLIYIAIMLGAPTIILGFLSLFKLKPTEKKSIYLYAFSAGMFLMIGSVGFIRESFTIANNYLHDLKFSDKIIPSWMALIIGVGAAIGLLIVILGRYLFVKSKKIHFHKDHEAHNHSDHLISFKDFDNPKAAWMAIIMLMSHRIIDGLFLGFSVYSLTLTDTSANANIPLIISFNIHILLEVIIVYYRQIQYGEKKRKAILYNFLTFLLIIPFIFIGAFTGKFLLNNRWLLSSLFAMGGSIIVFMSVFELIPEFIHARNQKPKVLYTTFSIFAASIVFTLILLTFHAHII
ncbi:ZIP family metal transporter [Metamycoplasma spumans]|uniref:ZIP family metal transporter n=1 Tax=Metamycoplasma spumans TaxID=92406 RepID=UPI0034DCF43B